jgi:molecular chaperone DnaK
MGSYHRVIGIDLGTTFSVVAVFNFDKQDVKVIPNRQNHTTTPSVVYISPTGEVSVGQSAREKLVRHPEGVIFEVKRMMGDQENNGSKKMAIARNTPYDPETISAFILKELKACAEKFIGEPIHDAVITVPAYFKEPQKNATREAAKIAKLNPRNIINEPTAAAVAYGLESGEPQNFIVYDLGGGTFDVSVIRIEDEKTVEVLGTGGNSNLGGGDIDQMIVDWVLEKMKQQFGQDFSKDQRLVGRLRLKAEQVKINLCNENADQEFFLENPAADVVEISYNLTTSEFESMIRSLLEKTLEEVNVALNSASQKHEITMDDIDAFILVGGSSKIPTVSKLLKEKFRKPIKMDLNPDEIVAIGAARMALNYEPSEAAVIKDDEPLQIDREKVDSHEISSTNIKDVVSHTLGVGLKDDVYDPLIPKDSVIPHRIERDGYTTAEDNQTSIYVPVYQGDNKKASLNRKLGEVVIPGLTPEPKGTHQFQITFALDADGIFYGEVKHLQTGKTESIKLDRGEAQITEKKRIDLAEVVDAGIVNISDTNKRKENFSPGVPSDDQKLEQLVNQAQALLSKLPADKREELEITLKMLERARVSSNYNAQGIAITNLTMLISIYQEHE